MCIRDRYHIVTSSENLQGRNSRLYVNGVLVNANPCDGSAGRGPYTGPSSVAALQINKGNGGGHNGHNGLKRIFENLGSQEFKRIRIGIDHPGDKKKVNKYVIQKGKKEEKIDRLQCIDKGLSVMEFLFQEDWNSALNKLNN